MLVFGGTATENHGLASVTEEQPVESTPSTQLDAACDPGPILVELILGMAIGMEQSIWESGTGGGLGVNTTAGQSGGGGEGGGGGAGDGGGGVGGSGGGGEQVVGDDARQLGWPTTV
jgi:hypothetical protein